MALQKIIVTENDCRRLERLLRGNVAQAIDTKKYIRDLCDELTRAEVVSSDKVPQDVITMNSTVVLRDLETDELETYTLVYPEDANIAEGKLSVLAPIGTAILGYREGDLVNWHVPSGTSQLRIEELVFQPERTGVLHL